MNVLEISSLSAPELAPYAQLTNAQLRNRLEREKGLFIAESLKVIRTALEAGYEPVSFLMERKRLDAAEDLIERAGVPVYTAPREVLAGLTGYELSRGVLCALRRGKPKTVEEVCAGARRVAVLEDITDGVNVGALFRSAAALGMDGVLVTPACCDPFYRRSVRVSMGAVLQIPWATIGDAPSQWPRPGLSRLKELGFKTAALALREDSLSLEDPRLAGEEKLALLLGSEGNGLSEETIALCDYTVRIPMFHGVDSLNVAAAGAVAFWELSPARGAMGD